MTRVRAAHYFVFAAMALVVLGASSVLAREDVTYAQADADDETIASGLQVFTDTCARCHQAGGVGIPGTFPPLLANPRAADPTYVEGIVSGGLSGPLEVFGVIYDDEMSPADLTDEQIKAVSAYVATLANRDASAPPPTTAVPVPANASTGKKLFKGSKSFSNGAASCSSCHTAGSVGDLGGPTLGPNLSQSIEVFGSETGLAAWLGNPPSETMSPIFGDHPLTDSEIADVVAFLADAPDEDEPSYFGDVLVWIGLAGMIALVGAMAIAWRGMRKTYIDKLRGARS